MEDPLMKYPAYVKKNPNHEGTKTPRINSLSSLCLSVLVVNLNIISYIIKWRSQRI